LRGIIAAVTRSESTIDIELLMLATVRARVTQDPYSSTRAVPAQLIDQLLDERSALTNEAAPSS